MRRHVVTAVLAVLLVAGLGAAVVAEQGTPASAAKQSGRPAHMPSASALQFPGRTRRVDRRLARKLAIFRSPRAHQASVAESVPPGVLDAFAGHMGPTAGANVALGAVAETPGGPVTIVPGNGTVCQLSNTGAACGPIAGLGPTGYRVISHSLAHGPNTMSISGIVPDDVTALRVVRQDGSSVNVPVVSNAFSAMVPDDAQALEYTTTNGVRKAAIDPPLAPPKPQQ